MMNGGSCTCWNTSTLGCPLHGPVIASDASHRAEGGYMKMTETEIDGLTHRCSNPECHVPAFIATVKLKREQDDGSILVRSRDIGRWMEANWQVGDLE